MLLMSDCPWCKHNGNRCDTAELKKSCDFRNLKFEKQAILDRAKIEYAGIQLLRAKMTKEKDKKVLEGLMLEAYDKSEGLKIMIRVLAEEFKMNPRAALKEIGFEKMSFSEAFKIYINKNG